MKEQAKKKVIEIVQVLNSSTNFISKYPIGNKELLETVKQLESKSIIKYDESTDRWKVNI